MSFDFAAEKAKIRQVVHDTLAISSEYTDEDHEDPIALTVRFHTKIDRFGDLENQGYTEIVEGIDRIIFNTPQLEEESLTLKRGGQVQLTAAGFNDAILVLKVKEPNSGPVEEIWMVGLK